MAKRCTKCEIEKPLSEFHRDKGSRDNHVSACRACVSVRAALYNRTHRAQKARAAAEWRRKQPDLYATYQRGWNLQRYYGISLDQFEALIVAQDGKCPICKDELEIGPKAHTDHDHSCCPGRESCGQCIRGVLCTRCNQGLGYFRDAPALLGAAIEYLERACQPR